MASEWSPSKKWLKRRFIGLKNKIQRLDSKTDRIDKNVQILRGELGEYKTI